MSERPEGTIVERPIRLDYDYTAGLAQSRFLKGLAQKRILGEKCPVCGDVVREVSFADSSLQYCATCQTGGKPLADRRLSKLLK